MKLSGIKEIGRRAEIGAWVTKLPPFEDLALKVRARFNADYVRRQKELFEAEPAENKPDGVLTAEAERRHDAILLLDTVLVDWRNLTDDEGNQIPYSRELAEDLITDKDSPTFRNAVGYAATVVATQGELELKAAEGN